MKNKLLIYMFYIMIIFLVGAAVLFNFNKEKDDKSHFNKN